MIRFDLKLLEENASNPEESKKIAEANANAKHACDHLKKLIGKRKCRKHPSSPNKIRIFASLKGDPTATLVAYCCPDFVKKIK